MSETALSQKDNMPQTKEPAPILTPPPGVSPMAYLMEQARKKYAAESASNAASTGLLPQIPTPEDLDVDERTDAAIAVSEDLISEAQKQLEAPAFTPLELTPAEQAETTNAKAWEHGYKVADNFNSKLAQYNQRLFDVTMRLLHELDINNIPVPADLKLPSPVSVTTRELDVPLNTHLWLQKRYNFREYSHRDFEAAALAERRMLTRVLDLGAIPEEPTVKKQPETTVKKQPEPTKRGGEERKRKTSPTNSSRSKTPPRARSSGPWQRVMQLDISAKW